MKTSNKNLLVYLVFFFSGIISTFLLICVGYVANDIFFGTPIQTIYGKDHYATLRSSSGILGYRLSVEVDGENVYESGKIWGISERQLRTILIWDKSGGVIALEKMGKIDFSYNADEKRTLQNEEIDDFCFSPMSDEYKESHAKVCEPYKNKFGY
jgi:hypothetical protein